MRMNIKFNHFFTIFLSSLLISCVPVRVATLKEYPPRSRNCHLDVYTVSEEIGKPYEELCILESKTGSNLFSIKTYQQAIELAKPEACQCGADAIIVSAVEKINRNLFTWGEGRAVVTGIRYK